MGMRVAMVSNGVNQERGARKLGIDHYFDVIVGSVHVGFAKPDPKIFHIALSALDVAPDDAIMVGDDPELDVEGARGVGMRCAQVVCGDEYVAGPNAIKDLWGVIDILSRDV